MNITFANKIPERLKELLKNKNISQSELARRVNLFKQLINGYCTGRELPYLNSIILICKELKESSDYLIGLKN